VFVFDLPALYRLVSAVIPYNVRLDCRIFQISSHGSGQIVFWICSDCVRLRTLEVIAWLDLLDCLVLLSAVWDTDSYKTRGHLISAIVMEKNPMSFTPISSKRQLGVAEGSRCRWSNFLSVNDLINLFRFTACFIWWFSPLGVGNQIQHFLAAKKNLFREKTFISFPYPSTYLITNSR
jgi:hypothetical protein